MTERHLTEDQLIHACLAGETAEARDHLSRCGACEADRIAVRHLLDEVGDTMTAEADAAFPTERLARQMSRILQRLDQDGRPGRVISFPAGQPQLAPPRLSLFRSTVPHRWVAGAAAAAFVIGVLAGQQLPNAGIRSGAASQPLVQSAQPTGTSLRTSTPLLPSDDEFLGELEMAVAGGGPAMLRRIDVVTPR